MASKALSEAQIFNILVKKISAKIKVSFLHAILLSGEETLLLQHLCLLQNLCLLRLISMVEYLCMVAVALVHWSEESRHAKCLISLNIT